MAANWKLKPKVPSEFLEKFPEISQVTAQLLYNRGLFDEEIIETFLNPEYTNLYDPFIFRDMEKAVARTWKAIQNKEKIVIYGDYDADAVTANAVLQQTFRYLDVPISSYIPDRFTEGYGLNVDAFKKLTDEGAQVVITVDCGTNSIDVAEFCKEAGIDLIITDHHEITGDNPQSFALINPKNKEDTYPDPQITGVGVAYKFACALLSKKTEVCAQKGIVEDQFVAGWDKWLLDLVAIGTVADCHSLFGENRILVSLGLKVFPKTKWLGLRMLLASSGVDMAKQPVDTYTLGFTVAPRINAAGRLEHAGVAVDLLMETDPARAQEFAAKLEQINKRRQDVTSRVVSEAQEQAVLLQDRKVILVAHADWHKGVVGLAAGRLAEQYQRPVIVLERGETESTGSARAGNGFNMVECLKYASDYLVKYGGHMQAAGLTVQSDKIDKFYGAILDYAEQNPLAEVEPAMELEAELVAEDLSLATYDSVSQLEPYGMGNPKPKFLIRNAELMQLRLVGSNQKHAQVTFKVGSTQVSGIGFSFAERMQKFAPGDILDIAAELMADSWNGYQNLKLRLVDIKLHEQEANY